MTRPGCIAWIGFADVRGMDESPCNVEFRADVDYSIHGNGPYRVVDSSHVAAHETQYELRRDYKPTLLSRQEAASFVAPKTAASDGSPGDASQRAVCAPQGPYVAVLTTDEGRPQNRGRQFDVLRIFHQKKEKRCSEYASERSIMSYDLQDYSIVNLAFPEELQPGQAVFRTISICKARRTVLFTAWSGIR